MCDFHSVIITPNGTIHHNPTNSHSNIASIAGLVNYVGPQTYYEAEWNGQGGMPAKLVRDRSYGYKVFAQNCVPALVERTAVRHYEKLALIVKGELDPMTAAPFNLPDYSDVQSAYNAVIALKAVDPIVKLIEELSDMTNEEIVAAIIEKLGIDMADLAKDEIQSAVENATEDMWTLESAYESFLESGDWYSQEQYDEGIEEAKAELKASIVSMVEAC